MNAAAEVASSTPRPVAESVATANAPAEIPRMPPKVPRKPWRRALVRVMTTPGPGLSTVVAATSRKTGYSVIMCAPGEDAGLAATG